MRIEQERPENEVSADAGLAPLFSWIEQRKPIAVDPERERVPVRQCRRAEDREKPNRPIPTPNMDVAAAVRLVADLFDHEGNATLSTSYIVRRTRLTVFFALKAIERLVESDRIRFTGRGRMPGERGKHGYTYKAVQRHERRSARPVIVAALHTCGAGRVGFCRACADEIADRVAKGGRLREAL